MIALKLYRITALTLNSDRTTPFSVFPHLIAIRTYNMRGIRILVRGEMVAEMHFLEQVRIIFFNGLATVNGTFVHYLNRVFRVKRSQGDGIVVVVRIVKFFSQRE